VGYIGGKTQTDLAAMDDLYIDGMYCTSILDTLTHLYISALGISDEVEKLGLKGSKKKKSRKLDEDYAPILKPLQEKDVPKVIQAIRQTSSRKVLLKLLTRIKVNDQHAFEDNSC
jgi:[histone H3]-lysine36 N-trimethyltransferase